MLTEETVIDKIEVLEDGTIQVRQATRVFRDGVRIAETYHRPPRIEPGAPVILEKRVADIASAVWTPEIVAAYEKKKADEIAAEAALEQSRAKASARK